MTGRAMACLGLTLALFGCGGGDGKEGPTTTTQAVASTNSDTAPQAAIDACHDGVKDRLKSPGTAVFEADTPVRVTRAAPARGSSGPLAYSLVGTVDSENSFGALVHNVWTCDASPLDGGASYQATAAVKDN